MAETATEDIFDTYPPELNTAQKEHIVQTIKDWTIRHGLVVRPTSAIVDAQHNPNAVLATNAPVTLFPSPFPKKSFDQANQIQTTYNELYAAIADDETWLEGVMKELFEVDDFIANLWKIHLAVKEEGYVQDISLALVRSDYMLNALDDPSNPSLRQVEFNTIASSLGGLDSLVAEMHTELLSFPHPSQPLAYPSHPLFSLATTIQDPAMTASTSRFRSSGIPPPNDAVEVVVAGLAAAHKAYGPSKSQPQLPTCVLFIVPDIEHNVFDQFRLSDHLLKAHNVLSFRLPVSQIFTHTAIAETTSSHQSRPLIYTPPANPTHKYEASLIYFRALYSPAHYTSDQAWTARHHLERSSAIKCPSVLLHLSGSKAVQQVLTSTTPNHLTQLLPSHTDSHLSALRATFAPQYSLSPSDPSSRLGLSIALDPARAENHVLKPQREGGGNNIYRGNIPVFLKLIPEREYKQYILMELIKPMPSARNTVLRSDGEVVSGNVISEVGIYGACLWRKGGHGVRVEGGGKAREIMMNTRGGYLVRTKGKDSDEGGVVTGFSSLDSLLLYEEA